MASNLHWTGDELLQRILELEKLDETKIMVADHMYTQKQQLKQHRDMVLKIKELVKGNLVLVYTLNTHREV